MSCRLAIAALAVLGLSCAGDESHDDFSIALELDTAPAWGCQSARCEDFALRCESALSVSLVDPESGEILQTICRAIDPGTSLCDLSSYALRFRAIPRQLLQIQVALWPLSVSGDTSCPDAIFDRAGIPIEQEPRPAFGGAAYFEIGASDTATVPLACIAPAELHECTASLRRVTAQVEDLETGAFIPPTQASDVAVFITAPTEVDPLPQSRLVPLSLVNPAPIPFWGAEIDVPVSDTLCIVTRDRDNSDALEQILCHPVAAADDAVSLLGLHLPASTADAILAASGLETLPSPGLVLGRVVDAIDAPAAGVSITSTAGSVRYLGSDFQLLDGATETSGSGYFLSLDAIPGARWSGVSADARTTLAAPPAGRIAGKLSLLLLRLAP